ncbi:hypothetical protein ABZ379_45550 [Streptomyces canus]|uniref:hypothetical protein n=1 Tax=Streptomyces canus TaxID=58343 RepID=UPI0033F9C799
MVSDIAEALDRAENAFFALLSVIGAGEHTLTVTGRLADRPHAARVWLSVDGAGFVSYEASAALGFCVEIGAGFLDDRPGALIARTVSPDGEESVRAWLVDPGSQWLIPRTADQVRDGYRFSMPEDTPDPEPHLIYRAAVDLPFGRVS